jgi:hypothetical protein
MKRAALLLFLALSVIAVPAFAQSDVFLLGFNGFDYESPNSVPGPDSTFYLNVGEGYSTLGFVNAFGGYLAPYVNTTANEYTYHYYDLTVATYLFEAHTLMVTFVDPGRGRFFEDSKATGTAATYGIAPPNAAAPANILDGHRILGGRIDELVVWYDYNPDARQGGFVGKITLDEGTLLSQIPLAQRDGWTLAGLAGRPNPSVPVGYDHQISGECRIPGSVPATHQTWGALKALYR